VSGDAEPVDEVDLSAPEPTEAPDRPPRADPHPRGTRVRTRRHRLALGAAAASALLLVGGWQHERAQDAASASEAQVAARAEATPRDAEQDGERSPAGTSVASAATAAATRALAAADASGPPPAWAAADVGARGGRLGGPLDLQVVGTWPASPTGAQRTGFRLLTGLPAVTGAHPCRVPGVRTGTWPQVLDARAGTTCEVRSAGERGSAVRTGRTGEGTSRVQVREVVLVSGGRAAVAAAWSTGSADPPLDLPALGAVAAAVVASVEPS